MFQTLDTVCIKDLKQWYSNSLETYHTCISDGRIWYAKNAKDNIASYAQEFRRRGFKVPISATHHYETSPKWVRLLKGKVLGIGSTNRIEYLKSQGCTVVW